MGRFSVVSEFWGFVKESRKLWLALIMILLLLVGAFIILTESSAVAPLIYTLF